MSRPKIYNPRSSINNNKLYESQYSNGSISESRPISSKILYKHLNDDYHPIFEFIYSNFDKVVSFIKPYYAITTDRIINNVKGLLTSNWYFELTEEYIQYNMEKYQDFIKMSHYMVSSLPYNPKPSSRQSISLQSSIKKSYIQQTDQYSKKYNRSILMYFWGPITLIILTHLLSNKPFSASSVEIMKANLTQTDQYVDVIAGGLIHLISMTIISFVMYVLFKVINSTGVHSLFQHITLSSFVGLNTIIFSLICSSGISYLIIPFALVYILGCSYLHINAYNQALKPQLLELIILSILLVFFYVCTGFMFYKYYVLSANQNTPVSSKENHLFSSYVDGNFVNFIHYRSYFD